MEIIINPSDIYYLTQVRPHEIGEMLVVLDQEVTYILCDQRTSGLFDEKNYSIISDRAQWGSVFKKEEYLIDPDILSQSLREKLE